MSGKTYSVVSHTPQAVTLKESGVRLMPKSVTIQRAAITAVTRQTGRVVVATSDGRVFQVLPGVRAEQRALTEAAFGM